MTNSSTVKDQFNTPQTSSSNSDLYKKIIGKIPDLETLKNAKKNEQRLLISGNQKNLELTLSNYNVSIKSAPEEQKTMFSVKGYCDVLEQLKIKKGDKYISLSEKTKDEVSENTKDEVSASTDRPTIVIYVKEGGEFKANIDKEGGKFKANINNVNLVSEVAHKKASIVSSGESNIIFSADNVNLKLKKGTHHVVCDVQGGNCKINAQDLAMAACEVSGQFNDVEVEKAYHASGYIETRGDVFGQYEVVNDGFGPVHHFGTFQNKEVDHTFFPPLYPRNVVQSLSLVNGAVNNPCDMETGHNLALV